MGPDPIQAAPIWDPDGLHFSQNIVIRLGAYRAFPDTIFCNTITRLLRVGENNALMKVNQQGTLQSLAHSSEFTTDNRLVLIGEGCTQSGKAKQSVFICLRSVLHNGPSRSHALTQQ